MTPTERWFLRRVIRLFTIMVSMAVLGGLFGYLIGKRAADRYYAQHETFISNGKPELSCPENAIWVDSLTGEAWQCLSNRWWGTKLISPIKEKVPAPQAKIEEPKESK